MARKASFYYNKTFISNESGLYTIVVANNIERMKAVFLLTGTEVWVSADQVDKGNVRDVFKPNTVNVGYLGNQSATDGSGNHLKEYEIWHAMLERCYGSRDLESYKYCIVSEEFHSFEYFYNWYNKQKGAKSEGWQLDKDILSDGCKIYAEDTCVLVPRDINMFFAQTCGRTYQNVSKTKYVVGVNWDKQRKKFQSKYNNGGDKVISYHDSEWEAFLAYKRAKETRAKQLAKEYYGLIDHRVYDKLMNYKVLLTD